MKDLCQPNSKKVEQILDAAIAEFQEHGFAPASMDRVSARAGVSKRTVYKYFESKEKLFQSIYKRLMDQFIEGVDMRYEPGRDIREQLTELARAEGRMLTSPKVMRLARLVMSQILSRPELAGETQEKIDLTAIFQNMLEDAAADGQLRLDDPSEATAEFLSLLKGRAFWPVILGAPILTEAEMEGIIAGAVDMMMARYGT